MPKFLEKRTEITATYNASPSDYLIAVVGLAAAIVVTLPDPRLVGPDHVITVKDETGLANATTLTVSVMGYGGVYVEGQAQVLSKPYRSLDFYSDGVVWRAYSGGAGATYTSPLAYAAIATSESLSSTTFTDLATVGPQVTLLTKTAVTLWFMSTLTIPSSSGQLVGVSVAVTGASSIPAADSLSSVTAYVLVGANPDPSSVVFHLAGLTPGINTFTMKYRIYSGGAVSISNRVLVVAPEL